MRMHRKLVSNLIDWLIADIAKIHCFLYWSLLCNSERSRNLSYLSLKAYLTVNVKWRIVKEGCDVFISFVLVEITGVWKIVTSFIIWKIYDIGFHHRTVIKLWKTIHTKKSLFTECVSIRTSLLFIEVLKHNNIYGKRPSINKLHSNVSD